MSIPRAFRLPNEGFTPEMLARQEAIGKGFVTLANLLSENLSSSPERDATMAALSQAYRNALDSIDAPCLVTKRVLKRAFAPTGTAVMIQLSREDFESLRENVPEFRSNGYGNMQGPQGTVEGVRIETDADIPAGLARVYGLKDYGESGTKALDPNKFIRL